MANEDKAPAVPLQPCLMFAEFCYHSAASQQSPLCSTIAVPSLGSPFAVLHGSSFAAQDCEKHRAACVLLLSFLLTYSKIRCKKSVKTVDIYKYLAFHLVLNFCHRMHASWYEETIKSILNFIQTSFLCQKRYFCVGNITKFDRHMSRVFIILFCICQFWCKINIDQSIKAKIREKNCYELIPYHFGGV